LLFTTHVTSNVESPDIKHERTLLLILVTGQSVAYPPVHYIQLSAMIPK